MTPPLVLVTTSFPISGDGSEAAGAFVADLAEELAKKRAVHVVAPGSKAECTQWADNIRIYRYPAPARPLSTLKPWHPSDLHQIARVLKGGLRATHRAVDNGGSEIFALWGLPCGEWARRVALAYKIPYSVWMLGSDVWSLGRLPLLRGALGRVIRQAEHAYADGYQLAIDAKKIGGRPVGFLPSTRRISRVSASRPRSQAPYRLLYLGRWHHNKGVDLLLEALEGLDDGNWHLIEAIEIQGGGPLHDHVHERVRVLKAQGRPIIAGDYLNKEEAESAIDRSDWLLIPSRIESIPVIYSDAMKMGRPVISMPTGDLTRLLQEHECGILAERIDANAYRYALIKALHSSPTTLFKAISDSAQQFDLPCIAERILKKQ